MKSFVKKILKNILFRKTTQLAFYRKEINIWKTKFVEPGHYYSPNVDHVWINNHSETIFNKTKKELPGIELNMKSQLNLLDEFSNHYLKLDFPETKSKNYNYYYQNQYFSYSDAISLSCIMLSVKPKKIIEIGSGFSSALMVDINEKYFENNIDLTFVEPFPEERLNALISNNNKYQLIKDFVQHIPLETFKILNENDILFIDSSHISKTGSDVNYLMFEIIPKLNKGVIIHIHDVFFPFEYPKEWIKFDRAWNEAYLLRAFLQFNTSFEIYYFSSYLELVNQEFFEKKMPKCLLKHEKWRDGNAEEYLLDTQGQSIYIKKIL